MSVNCYWRVAAKTDHVFGQSSCPTLRKALKSRFGREDCVIGPADREWLSALRDAEIDGADELLSALDNNEQIEVVVRV